MRFGYPPAASLHPFAGQALPTARRAQGRSAGDAASPALVDALGKLLDDLRLEGLEVVRLAAGDQALVDMDLLVDPLGAGIAQVGPQARPGGQGAPTDDVG